MRLLMLAPASAVHTQRWANGLCSLGAEVHVACLAEHVPSVSTLDDRITVHTLSGRGQVAYFTQAREVAKLARRVRPDVVNAHYASGYGTLFRLAHLKPSVLSAWGSDVYEFPDRGPLQRWLVAGNLRYAGAVTSSSNVMAARIAEVTHGGVAATVIPFGVDPAIFWPGPERADGRPVRFGIVKTLEPHYRIDVVIDAFARYVSDRDPDAATLDIYGSGALLPELQARIARLGVSDRVVVHGGIAHEAVPAALRALDVFVLASETESFGVAAVEAMACGVPVIASDAPGFVEVLDSGRYGLLYPRGDVGALVQHMSGLGADVEARRRLRVAGMEGARRYDWRRNVVDMFGLLTSMASRA